MAVPLGVALQQLNSDESDEDDDDYIPSGGDESDEEILEEVDPEDPDATTKTNTIAKRKKSQKGPKARKRKGGIKLSDDEDVEEEKQTRKEDDTEEKADPNPEKDKKKSDSLWADFLSDVTPPVPKKGANFSSNSTTSVTKLLQGSPPKAAKPTVSKPEKVTITKIFEFAGEEVEVKEEVDAGSKAAKEFAQQQLEKETSTPSTASPSSSSKGNVSLGTKKPGGLGAVLGQVLGKKSKLSTLEKSKLDWTTFKKDEGVEEELEHYKKGKGGYLDRQAFLERTDLKQFEIEKQLRTLTRRNRV